jgi:hypothetical protein
MGTELNRAYGQGTSLTAIERRIMCLAMSTPGEHAKRWKRADEKGEPSTPKEVGVNRRPQEWRPDLYSQEANPPSNERGPEGIG